jgi:membrane dipeptidase
MNELGILVDVSHCSDATAVDAARLSAVPIAMTHTAARAVYDHYRWKSDEAIQAVGERGYVGVPLLGGLRITDAPRPTLDHFFEHLDHVVGLVGAEHVGIGTNGDAWPPAILELLGEGMKAHYADVDHVSWEPFAGFTGFRDWPNLTAGLVARGYSDDEVRGFVGGNFLRVFRDAVG